MAYAEKLLCTHDFIGIQETHSTDGFVRAMRSFTNTTAVWARGSQQSGGIGLLVKNEFLSKFGCISEHSWKVLEEGRIGCLQLCGPQGSLHLYVVYMATGEGAEESRRESQEILARHMASPSSALSILMGDWNYVTTATDRFTKATAEWSGASDER